MNYQEAERRLLDGATKIKRASWAGMAYLSLENDVPMLLDLAYGAYWALTSEDKIAIDWIEN